MNVVRVFFFLPFACWPETAPDEAAAFVATVDADDEVEDVEDECDLLLMDPAW